MTGFKPNWQEWFKRGEWNRLRARIEGETPHIQVWLNDVKVTDWMDTANHLPGGATSGMVAVQVHAGNRWVPGGKHRFHRGGARPGDGLHLRSGLGAELLSPTLVEDLLDLPARCSASFRARFRLSILVQPGMGSDAHTASVFPGDPLVADRGGIAAAM